MARVKRYKFDLKYMQTVLHKSQSHRVFLANALTQFTFLVTHKLPALNHIKSWAVHAAKSL